jgi:hypothetical protein
MNSRYETKTVTFRVRIETRSLLQAFEPLSDDGVEIEKSKDGFVLKKIVEAQSAIDAENSARNWAQMLSKALSLVKGLPVQIGTISTNRISGLSAEDTYPLTVGRASVKFPVAPLEIPLTQDILHEALSILKRIGSPSLDDHVRRAITWYERGLSGSDPVDRFIDHWIGLEALSKSYEGPVESSTCKSCGAIINPRPDAAVLRGFLDSIGFKSYNRIARNLGKTRGSLFHSAEAMVQARSMQPVLTNLLKECLLRSLAESERIASSS